MAAVGERKILSLHLESVAPTMPLEALHLEAVATATAALETLHLDGVTAASTAAATELGGTTTTLAVSAAVAARFGARRSRHRQRGNARGQEQPADHHIISFNGLNGRLWPPFHRSTN